MTNWSLFQEHKTSSIFENQCNPPYYQLKQEKSYDYIN